MGVYVWGLQKNQQLLEYYMPQQGLIGDICRK
jgi:hypothetical protein